MSNSYGIPPEVEQRIRQRDANCVYCGRPMRPFCRDGSDCGDMATIEHFREEGPFYWSEGLKEEDLAICCHACNSRRGKLSLRSWFSTPYCVEHGIDGNTVAEPVRGFLKRTNVSKFEEIYKKYVEKMSPTEQAAFLVYFLQQADIHNEVDYSGAEKLLEKLGESPETRILANLFGTTLQKLYDSTKDVEIIEQRIVFNALVDYLLSFKKDEDIK